jgi:hypothetical protein
VRCGYSREIAREKLEDDHMPPVIRVKLFDVNSRQQSARERRVRDNRNSEFSGTWQNVMLDLPATETILHLHARHRAHSVESS